MNVIVLSRENTIRYCKEQHTEKTAIISISNPYNVYSGAPFISNYNGVSEILELCFVDADRPGANDVYGRRVLAKDLMQKSDAVKVKAFVERHLNEIIIVHCDAGISRSAGVAAALLKAYNGDDSRIFDSPRYHPNMHCYITTLRELFFT